MAPPITTFDLPATAPVYADGVVYVDYRTASPGMSGPNGIPAIAALRASDGALLWQRPDPVGAAALLVDHGVLVLGGPLGLVGLRVADGTTLWQLARGASTYDTYFPSDYDTPALLQAGGILYGVGPTGLYAVRIADGHLLWQVPLSVARGGQSSVSPTPPVHYTFGQMSGPLLSEGTLMVGVLNGPLVAVRASDGQILWRTLVVWPASRPQPLPKPTPLAALAGQVYVLGSSPGVLLRLRLADGHVEGPVPWLLSALSPYVSSSSASSASPTSPSASIWIYPLVLDGAFYVGVVITTFDNITYTLLADGGKRVWQISLNGWPGHFVGDDGRRVYLVVRGDLLAIDQADGRVLWQQSQLAPFAGPVVGAGQVYVSRGGVINSCNPTASEPVEVLALASADGSTIWDRRLGVPTP